MHFILPSEAIFSSHCKYWFKMFTLVAALLSQRQFGREVWGGWLAQTGACSGHQFPEQEQVNAQRMPLSLSKKHQPTVYVKSGSSACAQLFWSLGLCMQLFLPEFCVNTKHTEQSFKVTWTQEQLQKIKLAIAEWFCMPTLVAKSSASPKNKSLSQSCAIFYHNKMGKKIYPRKELICLPKRLKALTWLWPNWDCNVHLYATLQRRKSEKWKSTVISSNIFLIDEDISWLSNRPGCYFNKIKASSITHNLMTWNVLSFTSKKKHEHSNFSAKAYHGATRS